MGTDVHLSVTSARYYLAGSVGGLEKLGEFPLEKAVASTAPMEVSLGALDRP